MGGAQRFLYELVTNLEPLNYEIMVGAGGSGPLFEILEEKNIKTAKIKNFSNFFNIIKNFLAFLEICNLLRKNEPNTLYLISSEAGFSGSIAGSLYRFFLRKKIKIIYRIGGWAFKEPRNIFIKKAYLLAEKVSAPFKDIIIINSEFDRQIAIKNNIAKPNKIIVIYNGIDLNEIKFLPREVAKKFIISKLPTAKYKIPNTILVGAIANLYKNKGIEYLIYAIAKIRYQDKLNNKLNFVVIGEGPERHNLEKAIKKHELENTVYLTGAIPNAYQYLKAFDLFVLSSVKEGQPWVVLEAMAAGVPIVANNIAGIPEMIENDISGLLVEPADSEVLAAAIEKMLTHPSLANACAQKALAVVKEKFEMNEMIRKNKELF